MAHPSRSPRGPHILLCTLQLYNDCVKDLLIITTYCTTFNGSVLLGSVTWFVIMCAKINLIKFWNCCKVQDERMNGLNNQRTNHQALCGLQKLKIELQIGISSLYNTKSWTFMFPLLMIYLKAWTASQIFCSRLFFAD